MFCVTVFQYYFTIQIKIKNHISFHVVFILDGSYKIFLLTFIHFVIDSPCISIKY